LPDLAVDLARGSPSVIVTNTLPAALAAKAATSAVPVVFVIGEDPIKAGLVASLNRPNANVTGVTNFMNVLGAKRMELASEIVPTAAVLALVSTKTIQTRKLTPPTSAPHQMRLAKSYLY
jgi:putative tryptophan/tyrosine transport system substrate-binding protein